MGEKSIYKGALRLRPSKGMGLEIIKLAATTVARPADMSVLRSSV